MDCAEAGYRSRFRLERWVKSAVALVSETCEPVLLAGLACCAHYWVGRMTSTVRARWGDTVSFHAHRWVIRVETNPRVPGDLTVKRFSGYIVRKSSLYLLLSELMSLFL